MQAICSEPAIPRRKKHPELAYKTHEVLKMVNGGDSSDSLDTESIASKEVENRARSEERNQHRSRASPRSKSVDPYLGRRRKWLMVQSYPPVQVMMPLPITTYEAPSGIPKTTEYRSQFIWLPSSADTATTPAAAAATTHYDATPKKSISMGAIQGAPVGPPGAAQPTPAAVKSQDAKTVHPVDGVAKSVIKAPIISTQEEPLIVPKKVTDHEAAMANINLQDGDHPPEEDGTDKPVGKLKKFKTEYKAQFRPPSKYMYVDGGWKKMSRSADSADLQKELHNATPWYGEVAELRKKAGEYKYRSIGGHIVVEKPSESITRQEMIEQLSSRSSLSALALATTPSTTFKKSKELGIEEMPYTHRAPSTIRHHLDRTTLAAGESGVLITSPTRDHKLEPVQIQKTPTPKDSKVSIGKGKPITKLAQKPLEGQPPSKLVSGTIAVGKQVSSGAHRSPKRTPRPMSMIVPGSKAQVPAINGTSGETPRKPEVKRPRPTSLVTSSTPMRPKPVVSTRSGKGIHGEEHVINGESKAKPVIAAVHAPAPLAKTVTTAAHVDIKPAQPPSVSPTELLISEAKPIKEDIVMVNGENGKSETDVTPDDESKQIHGITQSESQEIVETMMMKSPPEPTRVKSPEQILVRSPEPVKWTIPLETGIKWTGTQKSEETEKQVKEPQGSPLSSIAVEEKLPSPISQQPIDINLSFLENEVCTNNTDQHEDVLSIDNETDSA